MHTEAIWEMYCVNKPLPSDWWQLTPLERIAKYICPAMIALEDIPEKFRKV